VRKVGTAHASAFGSWVLTWAAWSRLDDFLGNAAECSQPNHFAAHFFQLCLDNPYPVFNELSDFDVTILIE
jgi:hypothetical protein